jgi:AcrR family transcriptional regulator
MRSLTVVKVRQVFVMSSETENRVASPIIATSGLPDGAQQILVGAADVFARRGYSAASVRQLAEASRMSVPMVYYYFAGKEAVFEALMREAMRYTHDQAFLPATLIEAPQEALRAYVRNHLQVAQENPLIIRTLIATFFGPEEGAPPFDSLKREFHDTKMAWLVGHVSRLGRLRPGFSEVFAAMMVDNIHHNLVMSVRHLYDPKFAEFRPLLEAYLSDESIENHIKFFLLGAYDEVFDGV